MRVAVELASLPEAVDDWPASHESAARFESLARAHLQHVWRLLRRMGLEERDADDVTQQVLILAARKLQQIHPDHERSFLYRAAIFSASKHRRAAKRRREDIVDQLDAIDQDVTSVDEALDQQRARVMLDAIVGDMPVDLRAVFVLFEIEDVSTTEIAQILGVPLGTVASRLRRARQDFEARVDRIALRRNRKGPER